MEGKAHSSNGGDAGGESDGGDCKEAIFCLFEKTGFTQPALNRRSSS